MEEKKQPKINVKISVDWECGEEELLEQCKSCKTYDDLHKVLSDNIRNKRIPIHNGGMRGNEPN